MTAATPEEQVAIAKKFGLANVDPAHAAAADANLPFWAACALLEKESNGRNVYGHDVGGVKPDDPPTGRNFFDFLVKVMNGATSNGVGPCQITYAGSLKAGHRDGGYFRQMAELGLRPWVVRENMRFGFGLMAGHRKSQGSWEKAGTAYNGKATYGADYVKKCNEWRARFGMPRKVK